MIPQSALIAQAGPVFPAATDSKAEPPEPVPPLSETPEPDPAATDRPVRPAPEAAETGAAPANDPYVAEDDDPHSPAGPPPAFDASVLDRTLEAQTALMQVDRGLAEERADPAGAAIDPVPARDPYDVPPSKAERAMDDVGTLRRIEMPLDTATVNITR